MQADRDLVKKVIPAHPANFAPGRGKQRVRAIVLHTMAGFLDGTGSWFQNPRAKVSAHYGVGLDGTVHQYVRESDTAYHAGQVERATAPLVRRLRYLSPNLYTIGIETEDRRDPNIDRTLDQLSAVAELCFRICRGYGIIPSSETIFGHHAVKASKPCPGSLPVEEIIALTQDRFRRAGLPLEVTP